MPRLTTKDAVQQRKQAGGVMYDGQSAKDAGDDLFGDDENTPNDRAWRFTAAGLTIERELNNADWLDLTTGIRVMKSAQQLNVGDATLYGLEHGYIQTYEDMEKSTGYKASTIELFASLCRSIPRLVRTNSLTYSHYQQIAPLPEDERATWIQFAADNNLSYRALRSLIDFATASQLPAGDFDPSTLELPDGVTIERVDLPTLPASIFGEDNVERVANTDVKEVKKTFKKFAQCVEQDRLQDMPRDDLYLLLLYVQDKYNQRRKLGG